MKIPVFISSLALSILSAGLLIFSFPNANLTGLAWIGLVPLLWVTERVSKKAAFGYAYFTGLVFFLSVLFWIHHVTFLGLFLLTAYLALYFGSFGLFVRLVAPLSFALRLWIIPAGWVVLEYIRGQAFSGFGWASLGHSQAANTLLIQAADITGVGGISFMLVMSNVLVKEAIVSWPEGKRQRQRLVPAALIFLFFLGAVLGYGAWRIWSLSQPGNKTVRVAVIQGNISLDEAWNPDLQPDVVRKYLALSREALKARPDLIVWPETSFPNFIEDHQALFSEVKALARTSGTPVLVGAVTKEGEKYFNSALLVSADGRVEETYNKIHLVLFGEYIPFRKEFPFLAEIVPIDDFTAGKTRTSFYLKNGRRFAALICFEDTIPRLSRRFAGDGAEFLVNMTNDAWFKDSPQPVMHLDNALFRTVETRRPLIRATNTGVSCLIDRRGVIGPFVKDASGRKVLVAGFKVGEVVMGEGKTFYTKFGDVFTFACFLGILGTLLVLKVGTPRRRS